MLFEKYARKAAYQLVTLRDGYHGVMSRKKDFHRFAFDTIENIEAHSFQKLKNVLNHAFKSCPYYHELWKEISFDPKYIETPKEIGASPVLTKDMIEENKERMISKKFSPNHLEKSYTGGSSGTPISFFRDRACTSARIGRQLGILELCGYQVGARCGLIWGAHQDLGRAGEGQGLKRKFRKFAQGKETLSCTIMNEEKLKDFHSRLARFRPEVLYGYPNAIVEFANFVNKSRLPSIPVKVILCTAERLTGEQRKILSETFDAEVFNLYCTREHGCIGFECRRHDGFHLDIGSVYLEIIFEGRPAKRGEPGEIVITDLLNYGMPFIRYKIGDNGRLSTKPCDCGSNLPLLSKLDGRETDMLYRPDGSMVAGIMLIDMFLDEPAIKAMQIVQETPSTVDLLLVASKGFNKDIKQRAITEMKKYLGHEININIKLVKEIRRNPISGKYQEVVCKIAPPSTSTTP